MDYQSERHCSKTGQQWGSDTSSWTTSQNGTAPKPIPHKAPLASVGLPVRTALLQNVTDAALVVGAVGLPVRTALLQNGEQYGTCHGLLDYQSERHCSKTHGSDIWSNTRLDYQSERHCSKTATTVDDTFAQLDYQSERHCSKTKSMLKSRPKCWTTSQNGTAPKREVRPVGLDQGWTTSQNGTAPKPRTARPSRARGWTTSQNGTAPKPTNLAPDDLRGWTTSQNGTAPKHG